jgi:alanyl-tRNA synthetase
MMTSAEIRSKFLDFFASKGHTIVPSAPIVVKNDPTLLFTNAGMNQFKDYFLGNKVAPYTRAVDTQKCLRVSGKHNDLEEVGVDTYHHTMFEMLGNWSFGDYFKKEAIAWSWELLTEVYGIPKDKLYVTVFEGDAKENLPRDTEAYDEWKKWISPDRILMGNKKDNFWEMGDMGPCGPCTEIHVDCRPDAERSQVSGASLVNNDHPQVIEIWNNVFMQFNRLKDGSLQPLPAKHVDTGMGLERLVRVLQGKTSNYDTDIFRPLISFLEKDFQKEYGKNEKVDIAMRVIADHIRAVSFAIADGQIPSNTGAGYVIRRILRRAIRYGYSFLGAKTPFMYELVDALNLKMGDAFPELKHQKEFIKKIIKEEESGFFKTLADGMWKIQYFIQYGFHDSFPISKAESYAAHENKLIPGKLAFNLYDTDGFPLDLTKLVATENGFHVDEKGFDDEMKQQKARSRAATVVDTGDWILVNEHGLTEQIWHNLREVETKIAKYRKVKSKGKDAYQLVLEVTPFYAESGGQVGDTGILQSQEESISITDTKKENDLVVHFAEKLPSNLQATLVARVDWPRRKAITNHHSATHLLHAALRQLLGPQVSQKGSLVNEAYLRFDFSSSAVSHEELKIVEAIVNEKIRENILVNIREMPKEEAIRMGAMALFGEKYNDIVRVVTIDPNFSVELCGGTHVERTGDLGFFIITQETAVAAGVRRIEAKAGEVAFEYLHEELISPLEEAKKITKRKSQDVPTAIENLISENIELKRKLEKAEARQIREIAETLINDIKDINGIKFIGKIVGLENIDQLKKLASELKSKVKNYFFALGAKFEGKAYFVLSVEKDLVERKFINTNAIFEVVKNSFDGKGGGKELISSTGARPEGLEDAIRTTQSMLEQDREMQQAIQDFLDAK